MQAIYYQNCENERVWLNGTQGIFINSASNQMRNYSWGVVERNSKISSFSKGIGSKQFEIIFNGGASNNALKDRFYEVTEKDILKGKAGKLVVGDYYLKCFLTDSSKGQSRYSNSKFSITVKVTTDQDAWIKETEHAFKEVTDADEEYLDYPYDYKYGFKSQLAVGAINNGWLVPCDFKLIIYGFANNPSIVIGGHEYALTTEINTGEYVVIDSKAKTIEKIGTHGEKTNIFNSRNIDSYIFEKIPVGTNSVIYNDCMFDIILFEERSEPKWT